MRCANHPDTPARYNCAGCNKVYCNMCGYESDVRAQPVVLCLDCDEEMTRMARRA